MKKIPYAHQEIDARDVEKVVGALRSDWLTQGPAVRNFEKALCRQTGARYAVAVANGTAALHLVMMAIEVGQGDRIITSPITFSASANCALYVGAKPGFVDIDDKTYHMDPRKLENLLRKPSGRRNVKAVIPVHFMGTVADIVKIKKMCDKYGIKVIEDAAHALGAKYKCRGKWIKVGSCAHSDAAIMSFHPIKHITTAEGGAILTNDKEIYERISRFRHHGIMKSRPKASRPLRKFADQGWFYDIPEPGFNYRISDIQCALGSSQLKKLDKFVKKRRQLVRSYNEAYSDVKEIRIPREEKNSYGSYHLYVIRVPAPDRDRLYSYLKNNGILTQVNYIPVHMFSYYQKELGYRQGDFPVSEKYFEECLSLPLYTSLTEKGQASVIRGVRRFFGK
jgi:UDP-4-amino-4,6-dideoxy-N-acetyl-beta-L-altrosamine transaminase